MAWAGAVVGCLVLVCALVCSGAGVGRGRGCRGAGGHLVDVGSRSAGRVSRGSGEQVKRNTKGGSSSRGRGEGYLLLYRNCL